MVKIRLRRNWRYDKNRRLGEAGGFGEVFLGEGEDGTAVAIKRFYGSPTATAERELENAARLQGRALLHVMAILDSGRDSRTRNYFVVMPLADRSLKDAIVDDGKLTSIATAQVLLDIVEGLDEISELVHRDLKPANILYHKGAWKISDFGIAKAADEPTSSATVKDWMTAEYAAPEQWRQERATASTDIYALGCIGHELLTGSPPFTGPNLSARHCTDPPPRARDADPRLQQLLGEMLAKAAESRPGRPRIKEILKSIGSDGGGRRISALLAKAGADAIAARREAEVQAIRLKHEGEQRDLAARAAWSFLSGVAETLVSDIVAEVPAAQRSQGGGLQGGWVVWQVGIGPGVLSIRLPADREAFPKDAFMGSTWDVLMGADVRVTQDAPEHSWGASLWFTNQGIEDNYRWWEVGYMSNPLMREQARFAPFALIDLRQAAGVHCGAMGALQEAYDPRLVDTDAIDFRDRWTHVLALAGQGKLETPRSLPLNWETVLAMS